MSVSGKAADVLLDTSAAVAFVVADHAAHRRVWAALSSHRLGLSGHAWFETFSVLTRLPGSARRDVPTVSRLLAENFPHSRFLDAADTEALTRELASLGVGGGAVYDVLVAAAAARHRLPLATRDRRAAATYRAFDLEVELVE